MREITIRLDDAVYAQLAAEAEEWGRRAEDEARQLVESGFRRRDVRTARATAILDELDAQQSPLTDEEAEAFAVAEVHLMRAERRARAADRR